MANRDERVFLDDMLEGIDQIADYMQNISAFEFDHNVEKQDAVIRRIEMIGEAVKNIAPETRQRYPDIPWREMAGMRDMVIHQYFGVTMDLVWRVATVDMPRLKPEIENIIKDKQGDR